ncbi:GST-loxP-cre recombinase fusion protein [Carpediemonas membranifera]|uniref:GST-loxP-cre recombinase fusion protein n=1 Tax=Carpediemonas membranifera TaxID=201153 RepID=A0A8J6BB08_9EUKA|nr:GST-loxP-cre recombinase fusion protein [Carpediemonas membranifera]|eukprot:KAG9396512.1 GST-loxP-cre recombinase fusion protein [Carpediemonas membranifera]
MGPCTTPLGGLRHGTPVGRPGPFGPDYVYTWSPNAQAECDSDSDSDFIPSEGDDFSDIPPHTEPAVPGSTSAPVLGEPHTPVLSATEPARTKEGGALLDGTTGHCQTAGPLSPDDTHAYLLASNRLAHLQPSGAATAAGWVARFLRERDESQSPASQLRSFLQSEAEHCGPENVSRKGFYIAELAPMVSTWVRPAEIMRVVRGVAKTASTAGLTGGSRAISKPEMRYLISIRLRDAASFQLALFGTLAYLTVSRGREIFDLRVKDVTFQPDKSVLLFFAHTKTDRAVRKAVAYVTIDGFNPARALHSWIVGLGLKPEHRLWRRVKSTSSLIVKRDASIDYLRQQTQNIFGPKTGLHSFRKGGTSELALGGTPLEALLALGTWRRVESMRAYIGIAIRTNTGFAG